jgi:anti-sigma regulatory factor (Ser/Thr protein kinase)
MVLPIAEESCAPVRQLLVRMCRRLGVDPEEANEFSVAVSEAFSNAVLHGNGKGRGTIETRIAMSPTHCRVDLRYPGEPFASQSSPALPDDSSTGGRGRFLMGCFTDDVRYTFEEGLTHVVLTRTWGRR